MHDDLVALYQYDRWANGKMLDTCRKLTSEQYVTEPVPGWSSVRSTVYHIIFATEINLRAVTEDQNAPLPVEVELATVDDAAAWLEHTYRRVNQLWPSLTPERLESILTLQALGRSFSLPRWAMLRHIVNHSSYHRGQIASKLKRFGIEPPNTDFFWWWRAGVFSTSCSESQVCRENVCSWSGGAGVFAGAGAEGTHVRANSAGVTYPSEL